MSRLGSFLIFAIVFGFVFWSSQTEIGMVPWAISMVVLAAGIYFIGGIFILKWNVFLDAVTNFTPDGNQIAITFDDGPHPETLLVLDVLKKYKAKATFFCIGKEIEAHPKIFSRIIAEGHTVGNHSYSHKNSFPFSSKKRIIEEIEQTDTLIAQTTGAKSDLFRPPFGVTNPPMAKALKTSGHTVMGWSIRSLDTVIKRPQKLLNRVLARIKPGAILLLHDNREGTAKILDEILQACADSAFETIDIRQVLSQQNENQ